MTKHNTIKLIIISIACLTGLTIIPTNTFADNVCDYDNISPEVRAAAGCPNTNTTVSQPGTVVGYIVKTIVGILGLVAVVLVVYGGIQYMTSAGDPGKTKKAKDTILYALVGLAVCALSFAITQFAINAINNSQTSSSQNQDNNNASNQTPQNT